MRTRKKLENAWSEPRITDEERGDLLFEVFLDIRELLSKGTNTH